MKAILALALFALFAVANAAPVTQSVDWAAVSEKVNQVEQRVAKAIQSVIATAKKDNAPVGLDIEDKLLPAGAEARVILAEAWKEIEERKLTETSAKAKFDKLKAILSTTTDGLRSDIAKLSDAAQTSIRNTLNETYASVETLANEIYDLLRNVILAVDWTAVSQKVNQIEESVAKAVQSVIATAKKDNAAVGSDIEGKLLPAGAQARTILDEARKEIDEQKLTETSAKAKFDQLKALLSTTTDSLRSDIAKLSAAAQTSVRKTLNETYASVETLANEMYALLRA